MNNMGNRRIILFLAIGVIILWIVNLFVAVNNINNSSNLLGDAFGMANSLFSGLALVLIFYSIMIQRQELKDTREIMDSQGETLKIQQFENTFFNMMKVLENNCSNCEYVIDKHLSRTDINKITYKGNEYFNLVASEIFKKITQINQTELKSLKTYFPELSVTDNSDTTYKLNINFSRTTRDNIIAIIDALYLQVYKVNNQNLGHFFRYLHNVIEFVKRSDVSNKKFYFNLIQAQLSDPQLAIIFYNGISTISLTKHGEDNFRQNIDEFHLLENLNDQFVNEDYLVNLFYPKTNFKYFKKY